MGLIKAGVGAINGVLADQWKEFFYCEALDKDILVDVLAVRGRKKVSGRSSNKGSDNVISNGSLIAVADGQCMIIVEQGKIVEVCAEPGEFTYDRSTEPSIFTGKLGDGIKETFKTIGKRFTFGGDTAKDQRIYYFNTKEIIGNKYGTPNPVPFRVVDNNIGLDVDIAQRIIDFVSGSCYAINGNIKQISETIVIVTPEDIDITGDLQELASSNVNVPAFGYSEEE